MQLSSPDWACANDSGCPSNTIGPPYYTKSNLVCGCQYFLDYMGSNCGVSWYLVKIFKSHFERLYFTMNTCIKCHVTSENKLQFLRPDKVTVKPFCYHRIGFAAFLSMMVWFQGDTVSLIRRIDNNCFSIYDGLISGRYCEFNMSYW